MRGEGKDDEGSSEVDQSHRHLDVIFYNSKKQENNRKRGTLSFFARVGEGGTGGRLNREEKRLVGCKTIERILQKNIIYKIDF